ncbi:MAG: protocatechuate 3,4-dioxygenase subunit alpha [Jatrophihabitans sp.]
MTALPATPGQTIGPFFAYSLPYAGGPDLVPISHPHAVRLHGRVLDGAGAPVPDALLEIGQADHSGDAVLRAGSMARDAYEFTGWGRAATDNLGHYSFTTVRPGENVEGGAPFIALTVFARGLLDRLFTRIYLPGFDTAWAADPLLSTLPADRRRTLVADDVGDELRFDVRLQGENETVFLAFPGSGPLAIAICSGRARNALPASSTTGRYWQR